MPARYRTANKLGLLTATVIFVLIGAGVLWGAQRFIVDSNAVAHTHAVLARIDSVEARLRDAEAAERGYLLTGQVAYLADYRNGRDALPLLFDQLMALVRENGVQAERAQLLRQQVDNRIHQIEITLAVFHADGLAAAQDSIGDDAMEVSETIRQQARTMVDAEQALLLERAASSHYSANALRALALLGIPLGIVVIGLVYWLLVREIRLRARAENAGALSQQQLLGSIAQMEQHTEHLRELSLYGGLLQNCITSEEAIQLSAQLLSRLLPDTGGSLYRIRSSQDYAEEIAHWGEHAAASAAMLPLTDCWALRRGQTHLLQAGKQMLRCEHIADTTIDSNATAACIPMSAQGVQLGFLYLSSRGDEFLDRLGLVETAVEQLSMALSNLDLRERLRIQSIREPLTGLFNRRYLEESLGRELARCQRRGLPLALMMLDLDRFKAFNDVHGHAGGDALLAQFGQLLQSMSRPEDIACRYGGEEFTLILPEAGLPAAQQRAESIRAAVAMLRVRHLGQELPEVTVSIGVACFPEHGDSTQNLLQRADEALYRAKHAGRNRVELAR